MSSMTNEAGSVKPVRPPRARPTGTGRRYWRSLEERAHTPEFERFVRREFPAAIPDLVSDATRRSFLKLMGASAALAGMTGCRWPREAIVPYAHQPEGRVPGRSVTFASTIEMNGVGTGVLVRSYDGRPIKIEGNPEHPGSLGSTDVYLQAALLEMYDPDRSRLVTHRSGGRSSASDWPSFDQALGDRLGQLDATGGAGLAVLSEASSSPTLRRLRGDFQRRFPRARWAEYEPVSFDRERAGTSLAYGSAYRPRYAFDAAEVVVCFDADPMGMHPNRVRHQRDFSGWRRATGGRMNRLYAVEGDFSLTGSLADHRLAVRPSEVGSVARSLAARLVASWTPTDDPVLSQLASLVATAGGSREHAEFLDALAKDLANAAGRSIVMAGPSQPRDVHLLCHVMNAVLGNVGHAIQFAPEEDADRPTHWDALRTLTADMQGGKVTTLVMFGGNPVYTAPRDLDFGAALGRVDLSVHLSLFEDETSALATWHIPRAHALESWGDARAWDGTIGLTQPLIDPLYGGRTAIELVAQLAGRAQPKGYDLVRETHASSFADADFESAWRRALHDGIVSGSTTPAVNPVFHPRSIEAIRASRSERAAGMELVVKPDASVYDGRFANNGWLQEVPDPMTTVTWDNAAVLGLVDARALGVSSGDVVRISSGGRQLEIVAYVMPGQATGVVSVPLGYGRKQAGRVGNRVGFDSYELSAEAAPLYRTGVEVSRVGRTYPLAVTQDHFVIDEVGFKGRAERLHELYREADLETYKTHPEFAKHAIHHPPLKSLWTEFSYEGHKWGMTIDLSACTGCRTCIVACQSENNIPIVGKDQVRKGREMHWIRVDRYFLGDPDDPGIAHHPVTCHHCENAPCEQVCPVGATVHDSEGLNVMVYNRCIGTRYCSNNCPYKVRRFNWHNNTKHLTETHKMAENPDVSVRSRGVMEKCSFCIQRIKEGTKRAKNESRPLRDGEVVSACQQACPTQAITFGDLNDPSSRVRQLQEADRAYAMLAELNVKPRVMYLAKLRNPSPDLGGHAPANGHEPGGSAGSGAGHHG
jgi:molybdopterin-containing oxidoreductase family iron-sulfur binding subunit